ncbi:MAG TPA: hypothetical protein VF399_09445 [bacterium]
MKIKILLLTLLLLLSLSFAVQPVPKSARNIKDDGNTKTVVKNEEANKDGDIIKEGKGKDDNNKNDADEKGKEVKFDLKGKIKNITDKNGDKIIDIDSNNVNDQREKDFDRIKQLESKFKDLFRRDNNKDKDNDKDDNKDEDKDSKTRKAEPKKTVPPSKHGPGK